jgi:hypothetical protein
LVLICIGFHYPTPTLGLRVEKGILYIAGAGQPRGLANPHQYVDKNLEYYTKGYYPKIQPYDIMVVEEKQGKKGEIQGVIDEQKLIKLLENQQEQINLLTDQLKTLTEIVKKLVEKEVK